MASNSGIIGCLLDEGYKSHPRRIAVKINSATIVARLGAGPAAWAAGGSSSPKIACFFKDRNGDDGRGKGGGECKNNVQLHFVYSESLLIVLLEV